MARKKTEVATLTGEIVITDVLAPPAPPVRAADVVANETYMTTLPKREVTWYDSPWAWRVPAIVAAVIVVLLIVGVFV
jgi:hypothetical protein